MARFSTGHPADLGHGREGLSISVRSWLASHICRPEPVADRGQRSSSIRHEAAFIDKLLLEVIASYRDNALSVVVLAYPQPINVESA